MSADQAMSASQLLDDEVCYSTVLLGLLRVIVGEDVYRAQLFSDGDWEKGYIESIAAKITEAGWGAEEMLRCASLLLVTDHTCIEPRARDLLSVAMQQLGPGGGGGGGAREAADAFLCGLCSVYGRLSQHER
jgi:hypothetical protein